MTDMRVTNNRRVKDVGVKDMRVTVKEMIVMMMMIVMVMMVVMMVAVIMTMIVTMIVTVIISRATPTAAKKEQSSEGEKAISIRDDGPIFCDYLLFYVTIYYIL